MLKVPAAVVGARLIGPVGVAPNPPINVPPPVVAPAPKKLVGATELKLLVIGAAVLKAPVEAVVVNPEIGVAAVLRAPPAVPVEVNETGAVEATVVPKAPAAVGATGVIAEPPAKILEPKANFPPAPTNPAVVPKAPENPTNPAFIKAPNADAPLRPVAANIPPAPAPVAPATAIAPTPVATAAINSPARIYLFFQAFLTSLPTPLTTPLTTLPTPLTTFLTPLAIFLTNFFMKSHLL